ncbi:MAG: 6-phosphofructokinase [Chloroflexi bacterium]|nr:MAG: 6-phosphofructokinase [Chloroflexota bacterium]
MMKGRLAVVQSGGPTPVINASLVGIIHEAQQHDCFDKIYGLIHGIEGGLKREMIDLSSLTARQLQTLANTPAAALRSSRHKISDDDYEIILECCRAHHIHYFACIGGNGSMYVCNRLAEMAQAANYELRVVGVPKTIDNDLLHTDHTPGYGSAARFLALATRDTGLDLRAMATFDDVTILEALGRNAGWLAAATALAVQHDDDAPHLIYVPEVAFDERRFLNDVVAVHERLGYVFVVVSEGLRDAEGRMIGQRESNHAEHVDTLGRSIYSLSQGVASYLAELVREQLGLQARTLRPGLIGRAMSAAVSSVDRVEARRVGEAATTYLADGGSGEMITLERISQQPYHCDTGTIELSVVSGGEKMLPREYINNAGNMMTAAFIDYVRPLIGELPPVFRFDADKNHFDG